MVSQSIWNTTAGDSHSHSSWVSHTNFDYFPNVPRNDWGTRMLYATSSFGGFQFPTFTPEFTPEETPDMTTARGYFEVSIIEIESGAILVEERIVADGEEKAKYKVMMSPTGQTGKDLDDLHVIVRRLGDVPPKKNVQQVEIVNSGQGKVR